MLLYIYNGWRCAGSDEFVFFDDLFVKRDVAAVVGAVEGWWSSNSVYPLRPAALISGRDLF